jgi:hypothetical protein
MEGTMTPPKQVSVPDDDPLVEIFGPLPRAVSEDIVTAAQMAKKVLEDEDVDDAHIISVACSAYISGVMRVLTQLHLDSGCVTEQEAEEAALLYLQRAGTMYTKHGRTEH